MRYWIWVFNPAKDTEEPKLSEDTEIVEDALFGMEDLRPPVLPQPPGLEPGHSGLQAYQNLTGWLENLIEDWLTFVNRGVLGPLHQSMAATAHAYRHRDLLAGEQWFV